MMDKELKKPKVEQMPEGDSTKTEPRNKDRRWFIKKAIVAAPVILTVTSRPVWARNCTLSGQLSGNLSDQDDPPCGGEGCSCAYWIAEANKPGNGKWHYSYPPDLDFNQVFNVNAFPVNPTLLGVLNLKGGGSIELREVGCQAVAALQNAATAVSFDLTVAQVIQDFPYYGFGTLDAAKGYLEGLNNYNLYGCPFL